jgi:hypothetical protein
MTVEAGRRRAESVTIGLAEPMESKRTASPVTKTSAEPPRSQPAPEEEARSHEPEFPPAQVAVSAARAAPTVRVMAEPVFASVQGKASTPRREKAARLPEKAPV